MFRHLRINYRLTAAFLLIGLLPIAVIGWLSYRDAAAALESASIARLRAVREVKKNQIETYFSDITRQLEVLAGEPWIIKATVDRIPPWVLCGIIVTPKFLNRRPGLTDG